MASAENSTSADGSDCLSMVEVLAEQARLQEDASAVLGDSDEINCTYTKGYVQRQALYACATCSSTEPAGVCLACSYTCHDGHDLFELYTKRFFRCDCGNSKFQEKKCKLVQTKDPVNTKNRYNQNFHGRYCTCSRPYPDPEDEVEDEMIQCVVCEDWYHGRHLNAAVPDNEEYQEMVCSGCMDKLPFLSAYHVCSAAVIKREAGSEQQEVQVAAEAAQKPEPGVEEAGQSEAKVPVKSETQPEAGSQQQAKEAGENPSDDCQPPAKRPKTEDLGGGASQDDAEKEPCLLRDLQKREITRQRCSTFWPDGWRTKLCRCARCMELYEKEEVLFLLDQDDTVHAYEERGRIRAVPVSDSELEQNALSQMNRIQQVEVLQGFMDLKTELREFLKGFADSGKVVGEEDIRAFFSRMEARKQERLSGLQYHCK